MSDTGPTVIGFELIVTDECGAEVERREIDRDQRLNPPLEVAAGHRLKIITKLSDGSRSEPYVQSGERRGFVLDRDVTVERIE